MSRPPNYSAQAPGAWLVQTGVQLLTGFLLILPFQDKFDRLSDSSTTGTDG